MQRNIMSCCMYLSTLPWIFPGSHWKSMGLSKLSRVTWQVWCWTVLSRDPLQPTQQSEICKCETGNQCATTETLGAAYMRQWIRSILVQIMARCLFGAKPLSKPMMGYCQLDLKEHTSVKLQWKYKIVHSQKCIWKCRLRNGGHFVQGNMG